MLRLRPFELFQPETTEEAVRLLASHGDRARLVSGGTDLIPNLKLAYGQPEVLVSLQRVEDLETLEQVGDELRIGARTTLNTIATHELVRATVPVLADAVGKIASPQIRNMGTLGGNICLDTRCKYINQSELFRDALGGCLKSHGDDCHVVPGAALCVAALSSDSAPVLIVLGATAEIIGTQGARELPVAELYGKDGVRHIQLDSDEVVVRVRVPIPGPNTRLTYRKWAMRQSVDFPLVSAAVRLDCQEGDSGVVEGGTVVVGALGPRPKTVSLDTFKGRPIDESLAEDVAARVHQACVALPNIPYDENYRRQRLAVEVKRALRSFFDQT